jgi:hypothetical protein
MKTDPKNQEAERAQSHPEPVSHHVSSRASQRLLLSSAAASRSLAAEETTVLLASASAIHGHQPQQFRRSDAGSARAAGATEKHNNMKTKSKIKNHAAEAQGTGTHLPDAANARAIHIGELMVIEAHERFLIAKRTGNLESLQELVDIFNDAMDQVGNHYGCAKAFYAGKEEQKGQSHE